MPHKDPEARKAYFREYDKKRVRVRDPEKEKEYSKRKYRKNKAKYQKLSKAYYKANKDKNQAKTKIYRDQTRAALKLEVLQHYSVSKIPVCKCCGEGMYEFMSLDHVNGDGAEHRRKHPKARAGHSFYSWLKRNGFPEGLQVLCFNCNCAKGAFGVCPHQNTLQPS